MTALTCPHCGAANNPPGPFCAACDLALPTPGAAPRILKDGELAAGQAGQQLQSAELLAQAQNASAALGVVAFFQFLGVGVMLLAPKWLGIPRGAIPVSVGVLAGIGLIFVGLAVWARRQPLPAAIVGLILALALYITDAIIDPDSLRRGMWLKVFVIILLVQAIRAAIMHRRLRRRMAQGAPA